MFRKIVCSAGAAMAALGIAVAVPGSAVAEPTTGHTAPSSASATSADVTAKGIWLPVARFEKSIAGSIQCKVGKEIYINDGQAAMCTATPSAYVLEVLFR
ncbi:hypothetical protein [Prauserella cavernicola]|uniref:Uncharacterized protein n=1 Tax=Prauserella cavernicola TaxID=2800127 RepID=A0A934V2Y3_9PSEU|nr:hypothetical protein [Prauserella cavernicola]MBK1786611.1 hypothetical protein [Prauserella cavernicola]